MDCNWKELQTDPKKEILDNPKDNEMRERSANKDARVNKPLAPTAIENIKIVQLWQD